MVDVEKRRQLGRFAHFCRVAFEPIESNMTMRVWQLCVGVLGLLLSTMLLANSGYVIGLFFLAMTTVWLAFRLRIAEPGQALRRMGA